MSKVLVDLSDDEGGEEGGASKPKKEEPEDLGIPNVAVGSFPFARIQKSKQIHKNHGEFQMWHLSFFTAGGSRAGWPKSMIYTYDTIVVSKHFAF